MCGGGTVVRADGPPQRRQTHRQGRRCEFESRVVLGQLGCLRRSEVTPAVRHAETSRTERHRIASMTRTPRHWREYAMEGCCLGIFMISAVAFAIVLQHPRSPLAGWTTLPPLARAPMGVAMGLTNVALIYSPAGRRSVRT